MPRHSPPKPAPKVLVANTDFHGRSFYDHYGNEIKPGQRAWLNAAHANELNKMNRFWRRVTED